MKDESRLQILCFSQLLFKEDSCNSQAKKAKQAANSVLLFKETTVCSLVNHCDEK